jgi:membrane-associated phospholipid phosphatase
MAASVAAASDSAEFQPPTWRTWTVVPSTCLFAALLLLMVDMPVARFCRHGEYPRFIADVLNNAEPFGHAAGVVLIVVTVFALDPRAQWLGPALAASALGAGVAANVVKLTIARTRPRNFDLLHGTLADTFGGWFPVFSQGATGQSFPSAHTATAVGLAVMLGAAYPRGRWWFATLAVLVGLHRIQASAHYPSDVCVGAALGWLTGQVCLMLTMRWRAAAEHRGEEPDTLPFRQAV